MITVRHLLPEGLVPTRPGRHNVGVSDPTRFRRMSKVLRGYDVAEVDAFFSRARLAYERGRHGTRVQTRAPASTITPGTSPEPATLTSQQVRTAAFTLRLGGYAPAEVDLALDRLEDALAGLERDAMVAQAGEDGLIDHLTAAARTLQGRLERPEGERFARGLRGWERTYDIAQVDALCDRLWRYFNEGAQMSPDEVRGALFTARRGNLGYREPQVDAFLDRVVAVMVST